MNLSKISNSIADNPCINDSLINVTTDLCQIDDSINDQINNTTSLCKDQIDSSTKSKTSQQNEIISPPPPPPPLTTVSAYNAADDFTSKFSMYNSNEELLGSVTTLSSPAVRTSARVIQKMKMDSIRPASPPIADKKDAQKDERPQQKTPNQPKANKVIWTNIERNLFFEAINEYGKDFEAISHYINNKQKRKNVTDPTYKTKENVRQLYHQTFHKVSKYLRFSDDVKKHAQELYAIINFGEMRKKLVFINQKDCMKLKELVYKGSVKMRVKGKNILIKTPSCKALRKLNQLEEWQEEIKLPSKVDVFLKPANIDSWSRVQNLSQNPRIKTILPLQKRVLSLLKTLQIRWRSRVARLCEQTMTMSTSLPNHQIKSAAESLSSSLSPIPSTSKSTSEWQPNDPIPVVQDFEPLLCFAPPSNTVIHRPMVNLSEFMSSYSICLNSYEDRIGVTTKGERLCTERLNTLKESFRSNSKRQRHDSGSEKKTSPDSKRLKTELASSLSSTAKINCSDTSDSSLLVNNNLSSSNSTQSIDAASMSPPYTNLKTSAIIEIDGITKMAQINEMTDVPSSSDTAKIDSIKIETFENNSSGDDGEIKQIDITTVIIPTTSNGDLMSSTSTTTPSTKPTTIAKRKDSKEKNCHNNANVKKKENRREPFRTLLSEEVVQQIKKGWTVLDVGDLTIGDLYIMFGQDLKVNLIYNWIEQNIKMEPSKVNVLPTQFVPMDNNLNSLNDVKPELAPPPPSLGTSVELGNKLKQLLLLASMTEKTKRKTNNCACDRGYNKLKNNDEVLPTARSFISNKIYPSLQTDNGLFRQPVLPLRDGLSHIQAYKQNLNNARNKQSRWMKMRNSRPSKQVVVQRLLPLQPGVSNSYGLVTTQEEYLKSTLRTNGNASSSSSAIGEILEPSVIHKQPSSIDGKKKFWSNNNNVVTAKTPLNGSKNEVAKKVAVKTAVTADTEIDEEDTVVNNDAEDSLSDDPGIKSLLEISLPSPVMTNHEEEFVYSNNPPMSPMGIIRESPTDPKWYEDNLNDFSLSSFLGQLESACDTPDKSRQPRDVDSSSNLSTISETSIDYMSKFVELTQSMKNEQ